MGLSQGDDTASAASRAAAGAEIAVLVDFATDLANTQFAGAYVFGGHYADTAPFSGGAWDPARPPEGQFRLEVGARRFVDTNHSAKEIFIDTDVVDGLQALTDALRFRASSASSALA